MKIVHLGPSTNRTRGHMQAAWANIWGPWSSISYSSSLPSADPMWPAEGGGKCQAWFKMHSLLYIFQPKIGRDYMPASYREDLRRQWQSKISPVCGALGSSPGHSFVCKEKWPKNYTDSRSKYCLCNYLVFYLWMSWQIVWGLGEKRWKIRGKDVWGRCHNGHMRADTKYKELFMTY